MRYAILICFLLYFYFAKSQNVTVLDSDTGDPVQDVLIFNQPYSHSVYTNSSGKASLQDFSMNQRLIMQHPAYRNKKTNLALIKENGYKLNLTPSNLQLKEITIAANKWEQTIDEVPNQIVIMQKKDIQFGNPQTAADLLQNSERVFVQKSQLGGGSPMIRGFAANAVLIVVDGVRMNNAIFRGGNLHNVINIDPNTVASSEVILGPGSIIYGSDALGGVMDFHTLRPELATSDTCNISGESVFQYATANTENTIHGNINYAAKKWAFRTSITYNKFGDLKMGKDNNRDHYQRKFYVEHIAGHDSVIANDNPYLQVNTGYNQMNYMQKVRYRPNKKFDVFYNLYWSSTSNIPRYDRLIQKSNENIIADTLKYAEWYYGPQEWIMNSLQIRHEQKKLLFDQAKLILAHQRFKESRHKRKFNSLMIGEQFEKVNVYTANFDAEKHIGTNDLFYGLEYILNSIESKAHYKNIKNMTTYLDQTRYPDGDNLYQTMAAYASYKHIFGDNF